MRSKCTICCCIYMNVSYDKNICIYEKITWYKYVYTIRYGKKLDVIWKFEKLVAEVDLGWCEITIVNFVFLFLYRNSWTRPLHSLDVTSLVHVRGIFFLPRSWLYVHSCNINSRTAVRSRCCSEVVTLIVCWCYWRFFL